MTAPSGLQAGSMFCVVLGGCCGRQRNLPHVLFRIFAPYSPHRAQAGLSIAEVRCSDLLLFHHIVGQKAHQPAFEARHRFGLLDGGLRLLRAP